MKTVRINGISQDLPEGALVFDDFLKSLNEDLQRDHQIISSIRLNGRELTEREETELRSSRVEQLGEVEIVTANPIDLAYETLNTLEQYIDKMIVTIGRAAEHYRNKNLITGDAYFAKAIDGMDLFVQTIGSVKVAIRVGLNTKVAIAEATLVSIMNDLLDAKRQNNYVFLADLLDKDLLENLQEWRDKVFPVFRNWKTA